MPMTPNNMKFGIDKGSNVVQRRGSLDLLIRPYDLTVTVPSV